MDFKDLSLLKKVAVILILILFSPLLLVCFIIVALRVPFEYPKYKSSKYYKKYKRKYSIGITSEDSYKIINYLEEKNLSYDKFDIEKNELIVGKTTYLFPWFECISFNDKGECIIAEQDNYEPTLLLDDLKVKNRKNIRILINSNYFDKEELNLVSENNLLFVYDDFSDIEKQLK